MHPLELHTETTNNRLTNGRYDQKTVKSTHRLCDQQTDKQMMRATVTDRQTTTKLIDQQSDKHAMRATNWPTESVDNILTNMRSLHQCDNEKTDNAGKSYRLEATVQKQGIEWNMNHRPTI